MVEALFYGNALLSTPVGEASEILPSEFLCAGTDLAKGITAIHNNYESMRQKFITLAEKNRPLFSSSVVADQYLDAYKRVVEEEPFAPID